MHRPNHTSLFQTLRNRRAEPPQGELFAKAQLPRTLPLYKAEDERMPFFMQALAEKQTQH